MAHEMTKDRAFLLGLGGGLVFGLVALHVSAAAAQTASGGIDFTPLANQGITLIAAALTVVVGIVARFAISFLASKTKMNDAQMQSLLASRVDDACQRGIEYATAWAKQQVNDPNSPLTHVKIDNFFLAQAVQYVMSYVPETLAYFNLTEDGVKALVTSRLNAIMGAPAVNAGGGVAHADLPTATESAK